MKFLLDTNVVSELRKPRPHGAVLAWFDRIPSTELSISAVVVGEIQSGIERTRRQDPAKAADFERWLDAICAQLVPIPADHRVFREQARLLERHKTISGADALIAATAMVHSLVLVTRNEKDFRRLGIPLFNPFASV